MEQDASLRRFSGLLSRYMALGTHLQKCHELLPVGDHQVTLHARQFIAGAHIELKGFELALADLIDESMILHEDLRQRKFKARRRIAGSTGE